MSPVASYLVETGVTLLAVVALAVLILLGARRLGVGRPLGPMQLLGRLPLDARRSVFLVQIGKRVLVLGVSEAGLTRLGQVRADELPRGESPPGATFANVLDRWRRKNLGPSAAQPSSEHEPAREADAESTR